MLACAHAVYNLGRFVRWQSLALWLVPITTSRDLPGAVRGLLVHSAAEGFLVGTVVAKRLTIAGALNKLVPFLTFAEAALFPHGCGSWRPLWPKVYFVD